jgi:hypothetical protein
VAELTITLREVKYASTLIGGVQLPLTSFYVGFFSPTVVSLGTEPLKIES